MTDFVRAIPVHWNDCDPARIVFHAHYFRWMDEGFHELARARGAGFDVLAASDPAFRGSPLVSVRCDFRAPAEYGDTIEHCIAAPDFGAGRSFRVRHAFRRGGTLLAEGEQIRIWGLARPDGTGLQAVPVPPDIMARLRG
ncbi:acyl-CoA thioesterase [Roseomonas sp. CCTCC AB2023176]|uniref:acyl-CoA thioesterase n=1 Tax=Roseomonas sp. CCTCC AB2023176 TaxID=3342640 RepID=UPI0035D698E8